MFARPEACSFCYHFNTDADGAMSHFVFAGAAFGVRLTVVTRVGCTVGAKIIARPSADIGRPKRVKKPTARPKTVVGTV
jgi:hypothetical protein